MISDRLLTKEATGDYDIMGTQKEKKKGLVQRGFECLNQNGWKYTWYVIRTGEFRRDEDDVYTVAESRAWNDSGARKDVVLASSTHSIYEGWMQENETYRYSDLAVHPRFSVVVPVYNVREDQLVECIESVRGQSYENWELILVDDHSSWESVRTVLRRYQGEENIKVLFRSENGNISRATNDGIAVSNGDFIAFMDCDDVLAPTALYEMAYAINEHPEYDFIYSDEDKLSEDGALRHDPFFKPDWSPDTFFSMMYTNHLAVYRAELVKKTGGLRPEFDGAQDYDFTLRFLELTDNSRIGHIAKVLYYWRERAESAATGAEAKPYALLANQRAKEEALVRRGIPGHTEFVEEMNQYRVVYDCGVCPLVSIIIPSKDNVEILTQCLESIRKHTGYPNYEIILVDNGSSEENREKISSLAERYDVHYHYEKMEFNFSRMCNIGVDLSKGEYLLLLNDDIEVIQDDWLNRMVGQALQSHTGAVGAKLLYPGTTKIQHDGVINRRNGPTHILQKLDDKYVYYYGRNRLDYDCFAVTGACLLLSKAHYLLVGKMDEELYVTYNDVDLCLNLADQGLYNVVRNDVVLYHHESVSRGLDTMSHEKLSRLLKEQNHMWEKHPGFHSGKDPYYSRHFGEDAIDFTMHKWNMAERVTASVPALFEEQNLYQMKEGTMLSAGYLAPLIRGAEFGYQIDEVRLEENHTYLRGYMYLKSRVPLPVYLDRWLLLTAEDGGQVMTKLNREVRLDIHANRTWKDSGVGFTVRIPDHLIDRQRTSYRVCLLLKSAGDAYSVGVVTKHVIPKKEEEYCVGVHLGLHAPAVSGHGMRLTAYNTDAHGTLQIGGFFEGEQTDAGRRNCYLVVKEKEGPVYYHLWNSETQRSDKIGSAAGFSGRIRSKGEVQAVLYVDRVRNAERLYPITYDLLCRQLGGDTAYWNRISKEELKRQSAASFADPHTFSILVPLYNTPEKFLEEMIGSVRAQTYGNWQLCLADGSDDAHEAVGELCRREALSDSRIVYQKLERNGGISENTNECMKLASGDWIALFDHDDLLSPNALFEAMKTLQAHPETELIYTDEDKVDETGKMFTDPHFKPDYDPELLRTNNYICHFLMIKKELADRVGGLRTEYNGAQDFDYILRCTEETSSIVHIPKVLYHWRIHAQSTAGRQESKLYAYDAGQKAIVDHLNRCGVDGALVERTERLGYYRVVYPVRKEAGISILIRAKDQGKQLERCVAAICSRTSYPKYEILIADAGSKKGSMRAAYRHIRERYGSDHPIHIYREADLERKARGTYLVELDPSCEIQTEDWLERMVGNLQRTQKTAPAAEPSESGTGESKLQDESGSDIYAVCAKIIHESGQIVSCGLTDHEPGSPYPAYDSSIWLNGGRGSQELTSLLAGSQDPGYFARAIVQQTVCGTDRWCFMVKRQAPSEQEAEAAPDPNERRGKVIFCPDVVLRQS